MQAILVTGANKGIGSAVVEAILREQSETRIYLGARDLTRGNAARDRILKCTKASADNLSVLELDVSDQNSVISAVEQFRRCGDKLVGLVNNAGIASGNLSQILDVNVYGMQRVNEVFMQHLGLGARVVNVTSASGPMYVAQCADQWQYFFQDEQAQWPSLDELMCEWQSCSASELERQGLLANGHYGLSKACANLLNIIHARENPKLIVNACTPGYIETDLTREMTGASGARAAELGMKQPADGARVIVKLLLDPIEETGHFFGSDGVRSPLDRYRAPGTPAYTGAD